jgi:hypothetical protein
LRGRLARLPQPSIFSDKNEASMRGRTNRSPCEATMASPSSEQNTRGSPVRASNSQRGTFENVRKLTGDASPRGCLHTRQVKGRGRYQFRESCRARPPPEASSQCAYTVLRFPERTECSKHVRCCVKPSVCKSIEERPWILISRSGTMILARCKRNPETFWSRINCQVIPRIGNLTEEKIPMLLNENLNGSDDGNKITAFLIQWLRLTLSKGPNGAGVSFPSSEDGNRSSFWNFLFFFCI